MGRGVGDEDPYLFIYLFIYSSFVINSFPSFLISSEFTYSLESGFIMSEKNDSEPASAAVLPAQSGPMQTK